MGCSSSTSMEPAQFQSKYALGEKIGEGAFANVHAAQPLKSSVKGAVAVKIQSWDDSTEARLQKEVCLWSRLGRHRNCVRMYEHFFTEESCYIVMERCCHALISHIKSLSMVTEASLADVFTQMLQGISYMHSTNIAHRDIKPANFFVGGNDGQTVKLGDFGLAEVTGPSRQLKGVCGTPPYMCPEMLLFDKYDLKADVWSFGVIVYLLFCGDWPYKGIDSATMKKSIMSGRPPAFFTKTWLSPLARNFVSILLKREPSERPAAASALNAAFLKSSGKATICLDDILASAELTGAFEDRFSDHSKTETCERTSKALPQYKGDALEKHDGSDCCDSDCQKDSKSTICPSVPNSSGSDYLKDSEFNKSESTSFGLPNDEDSDYQNFASPEGCFVSL